MNLHEYQAKEVLARFGVPVPRGKAVATAEEMPVNETIDLRASLRERVNLDLDLAIVNALEPDTFSEGEIEQIRAAGESAPVEAAVLQWERARRQHEQLARLGKLLKRPLVTLPFVYERSIGRTELQMLADELADRLAAPLAEAIEYVEIEDDDFGEADE